MRYRIWVALGLSAFGWGSGNIANRVALVDGVDAYTIIALRLVLAGVLVLGYLQATRQGPGRRWDLWWRGGLLGLAAQGIPMVFITLGLNHISAGLSGMLIGLAPIVTLIWAHFMLRGERLVPTVVLGMMVALGGVSTLVLAGDTGIAGGGDLALGAGLTIVAVIMYGIGGGLTRLFVLNHSVLGLAGPQFVVAMVVGLVSWLAFGAVEIGSVTAKGWLMIVYLGVVATALPYLAFLWASRLATATRASVVGYLIPPISVVGGIIFLSEELTWLMALGGLLVAIGVVVVDHAEARRRLVADTDEPAGAKLDRS